jgi:hypothetical protein
MRSAQCAANRVPVIRMYNNGKGGQANHRYLTSHSEVGVMLGQGWIVEGPVFCTPRSRSPGVAAQSRASDEWRRARLPSDSP